MQNTFARGARQLVVHDAFDTMSSFLASYFSSFTPMTNMGASAYDCISLRLHLKAAKHAGRDYVYMQQV